MQNDALLPHGFYDLLPHQADLEGGAVNEIIRTFKMFGYSSIKPPMMEFEETLIGGTGKALSGQTFRVMDPCGNKMLAIRSDITPQIARIAASRLKDEARPLRLCYSSESLSTRGELRQVRQVGCEIIGSDDIVEAILLAALSLKNAGIENLTIDITLPDKVRELDLSGDALSALLNRDRSAIKKLAPQALALLDSVGELKDFDELSWLHGDLLDAFEAYDIKSTKLSVDPVETSEFEYHSGIGFSIFANEVGAEIGKGGIYKLPSGEIACGVTLYMECVMKALSDVVKTDAQSVSKNTSWREIKAMQDSGKAVVRK